MTILPRWAEILPTSNFSRSRLGGKESRMAEIIHGPCDVACFADTKGIYIKFPHNGHARWIPESGDKHWTVLRTIMSPDLTPFADANGRVTCDNSAYFSPRQMS
jgi:hypothetical protein